MAVPRAEFRSYYGRPVLKPPVWEWKVPAYLFTGGLSAGLAVLGAGADLTGRPALRRVGRIGSLVTLLVSVYLLVADLGRPERFHHMLRVAKPTSPAVASYTALLLSQTAAPAWHEAHPHLPVRLHRLSRRQRGRACDGTDAGRGGRADANVRLVRRHQRTRRLEADGKPARSVG